MAEWKEYKVGDIAEVVMGQSPDGETCNQKGQGLPLLNGPTEFTSKFPLPVQFTTDPKRICKTGDILFCVRGSTTGRMNIADQAYAIGRGIAAIRHKSGKELLPFLKGLIDYSLPELLSITTGSVFPNITGNDLLNHKVILPPLAEQQAIAEVLSSLDDKKDLLHRQNKTLEALAETLFRQWFVDEAKDTWELVKVGDLFTLQRGFDLPANRRTEGQYPILSASGITGYHNEYKVKGAGVTTGRSGLLGKVFYVPDSFWPLNTSLFIVEHKLATPLFAYYLLKTLDLSQLNGGSAVPTLNRNDVHAIDYELPPKKRIAEFEDIATTYFEKIKSNKTQIRSLTALRDALLPKLMSGEVRVKTDEAETASASQ